MTSQSPLARIGLKAIKAETIPDASLWTGMMMLSHGGRVRALPERTALGAGLATGEKMEGFVMAQAPAMASS
ncbi:hypothetical protein [Cobetia marina]|uniref:hypothetical protein n=1 Tax=Cobetia marina TaxID=28258 RepID=UPI00384D8583